jgi:hypothetical protein
MQDILVISPRYEVFEICQFGKQSRLPFLANKTWRASEKLQLVHTNFCGPMKTLSFNGSCYYIAFIDEFSRMCWVYYMKSKFQVVDFFGNLRTGLRINMI